jgi:hypothetical protein
LVTSVLAGLTTLSLLTTLNRLTTLSLLTALSLTLLISVVWTILLFLSFPIAFAAFILFQSAQTDLTHQVYKCRFSLSCFT